MQIFIYCKVTLHVSGVTAPIIRSTKNCNRSLRYKSLYWYSYFPPTWPDRATLEGSSCILLHLVGVLLTLNYDARNHEFKKMSVCSQILRIANNTS